jgi:hypothetical protein
VQVFDEFVPSQAFVAFAVQAFAEAPHTLALPNVQEF